MADLRLCLIPDCGKPVRHTGYCSAHYSRLQKHGDPLGGRTARGAARDFLMTVVMNYEGDECLTWPFTRDKKGYGRINLGGIPKVVSRVVCEKVNGPPIGDRNEAAHNCNNGHLGCVTKRHISWKTNQENHQDKMAHGTTNRGERCHASKLTAADVLEIRYKVGTTPTKDLAAMFGVATRTIRNIRDRDTWAHLP